jgi:hypothetical protein
MNANMGATDKKLRSFVVAPLAVILAFVVGIGKPLGIVLIVVAAIMVLTSVVSFCPLYRIFGINTGKGK